MTCILQINADAVRAETFSLSRAPASGGGNKLSSLQKLSNIRHVVSFGDLPSMDVNGGGGRAASFFREAMVPHLPVGKFMMTEVRQSRELN